MGEDCAATNRPIYMEELIQRTQGNMDNIAFFCHDYVRRNQKVVRMGHRQEDLDTWETFFHGKSRQKHHKDVIPFICREFFFGLFF